MSNILRKVETEEVIIYTEAVYSIDTLNKCKKIHRELVADGKLEGDFEFDKWMGYSGIKKFGIKFSLDATLYNQHIGKEFGISVDAIKKMLKCYAIYCCGAYIYSTIARQKIGVIKEFLQRYGDKNFKITDADIQVIKDFLGFIGTPDKQIDEMSSNIVRIRSGRKNQRKLSPVINYLVIANEINEIYRNGCDDEIFKKWFPIYFWINITFILPLRATEMLLTPKECIYRENGRVFLKIRRTKMKKGKKTVYYDIEKDYKIFTYDITKIMNIETVRNIEKYMELTKAQERRFLFEYKNWMINEMVSLSSFNYLIRSFIEKNVIDNSRYDFVKFATGIDEFEFVTAGDSRPIAMANLYFQNVGEDICRQLADHINIDTSAGYYTNISETIWGSSIIYYQKLLNKEREFYREEYEKCASMVINTSSSYCLSLKKMINEENDEDCVEQGCMTECMGCKFYVPSKEELEIFLEEHKRRADDNAKKVIEIMNDITKNKVTNLTMDEVFLSVQTAAARYRMGCDVEVKEKVKEWRELRNTQRINC